MIAMKMMEILEDFPWYGMNRLGSRFWGSNGDFYERSVGNPRRKIKSINKKTQGIQERSTSLKLPFSPLENPSKHKKKNSKDSKKN